VWDRARGGTGHERRRRTGGCGIGRGSGGSGGDGVRRRGEARYEEPSGVAAWVGKKPMELKSRLPFLDPWKIGSRGRIWVDKSISNDTYLFG